jgi:cytoskeletal protein RodZ
MAARCIGESVTWSRWWPGQRRLCACALLTALAGVGLLAARGQAVQQGQTESSQPSQNSSEKKSNEQPAPPSNPASDAQTNSSDVHPNVGVDPAEQLLNEFPADSTAKSDNDPRDGHLPSEPKARPLTPEEENPPKPAAASVAAPVTPTSGPSAAAALPKPAPAPEIELPKDPKQRQVAIECGDLLKMANDLKSAVDKSTKDELSLDVVRKAGEIEQYAHRVREGTRLTAGTQ